MRLFDFSSSKIEWNWISLYQAKKSDSERQIIRVSSHMQKETIFKLTCVLYMYKYTYEYNMYTQVERGLRGGEWYLKGNRVSVTTWSRVRDYFRGGQSSKGRRNWGGEREE